MPGQQRKVFAEVHVRQHFEDDVHAASAGETHDYVEVARRAMVDDVVRAVLDRKFSACVSARRTDNGQPGRAGDLRRGQAHPAAGAVDEHDFSSQRAGAVKQRAMRRRVRDADRRALGE